MWKKLRVLEQINESIVRAEKLNEMVRKRSALKQFHDNFTSFYNFLFLDQTKYDLFLLTRLATSSRAYKTTDIYYGRNWLQKLSKPKQIEN